MNNLEIFIKNGLHPGRLLGSSKSGYRDSHPEDLIVFNSNVITKTSGKIWYGDLNINLDRSKLDKISAEIGEPLYILYEMDARFEHENDPIEDLIKKAVFKTENSSGLDISILI